MKPLIITSLIGRRAGHSGNSSMPRFEPRTPVSSVATSVFGLPALPLINLVPGIAFSDLLGGQASFIFIRHWRGRDTFFFLIIFLHEKLLCVFGEVEVLQGKNFGFENKNSKKVNTLFLTREVSAAVNVHPEKNTTFPVLALNLSLQDSQGNREVWQENVFVNTCQCQYKRAYGDV